MFGSTEYRTLERLLIIQYDVSFNGKQHKYTFIFVLLVIPPYMPVLSGNLWITKPISDIFVRTF